MWPKNKAIVISIVLILALSIQPVFAMSKTEKLGDVFQFGNSLFAAGVTAYYHDKEGFYQLAKITITNTLLTDASKRIFNKIELRKHRFGRRPNGLRYNFPSGHASATFSAAWFIYRRYGLKYALLPFATALFTGYSRIDSKKHDIKAIVGGAALGILSAELFATRNVLIEGDIEENRYTAILELNL